MKYQLNKYFSFKSATVLVLLLSLLSFRQSAAELKIYDGEHFSISYPADWKMENSNEIVHIFPANEIGAITISGYEGVELNEEDLKKMMRDITGVPDVDGKISVKSKNGYKEYYHEYADTKENVNWVTKIFRKGNDLQMVTVNCETKYWNGNYRMMFLDALKSYKPKN